jgi:glucosamine-6-phosphate deaminase
MADIFRIPKELVGVGSPIACEVVETEEDLYYTMALDLFEEIKKNNERGEKTVCILPVGPVAQYRIFVNLVNKYRLSLKNVYIFNMDEYLDDNKKYIDINSPLSFRGYMDREFYAKIDERLNIPKDNRYFPDPDNLDFYGKRMEELGGVDICLGGLGINGHIAFNEPPEKDQVITKEEFANLKTRVLKIAYETRIVNGIFKAKGCIDIMPEWCVTVGMKEILSSRKIRIYVNTRWQNGVLRKCLHGPVTPEVPASLLQEHNDSKFIVASYAAEVPL